MTWWRHGRPSACTVPELLGPFRGVVFALLSAQRSQSVNPTSVSSAGLIDGEAIRRWRHHTFEHNRAKPPQIPWLLQYGPGPRLSLYDRASAKTEVLRT
eukprot:CAMPEP_0174723048 /NCGR_PEP_ID=MMETSP1094-20130205/39933_1 /TAXON_ID=156173 /ORGANISM="Chrysochromulina brevifilum, Strain UTEX LB 985" /LENGTH=98 /DNA_ID=CAMNT_0015924023 /DNA_START=279 /DNA_END=576 /DNA_ORIENTATION=-